MSDFWDIYDGEYNESNAPPEIMFLKKLEDRNGGFESMGKLFKNLYDNHPQILQAWTNYLEASYIIVKHNPHVMDELLDSATKVIQNCLTGDNLTIIAKELAETMAMDLKDPKTLAEARHRMSMLLRKFNPPSVNPGLIVDLPSDIAQQLLKKGAHIEPIRKETLH